MQKKIFMSRMQKKIFTYYLSIMACLVIFILLLYIYLVNIASENVIKNQMELTEKISDQIEMFLLNMDRISLQVIGNADILATFEGIAPKDDGNYFNTQVIERKRIQDTLLNINGPKFSVGRISIYNNGNDYVSYGKYPEKNTAVINTLSENKYDRVMETFDAKSVKKFFQIQQDSWGDPDLNLIALYRPLKNTVTGKVSGVVEIQTKADELFKLISINQMSNVKVYVFDNDNTLIYPLGTNDRGLVETYSALQGKKGTVIKENRKNPYSGKKEEIIISSGTDYKWKVVVVQAGSGVLPGVDNFLKGVLLVIILITVITAYLIFIISGKLTEPLVNLVHSVQNVRLNNLSVIIDEDNDMDIVRKLNRAFQKMFLLLDKSIKNEMQANLQSLQAQMNPHFLYNVLSVITATGIEEGSEKVPMLCEKLSDMLRYSSSYDERIVPIDREITYARNYCDMMGARYEHKLDYEIKVEGDTRDIYTPKIVLQPVIENCFRHAFLEADYQWKIRVLLKVTDHEWCFMVTDNGTGFSEEKIKELHDYVEQAMHNQGDSEKPLAPGLGLKNTILRLNMACKEKIFYEIRNNKDRGATVIIGGMRND